MAATLPPPDGLEERARSAYSEGDLEGAIAAWEQLHTLRLGTGDVAGAAQAAAMVATHLLIDTGLMAPVRGWLLRAERLLEPLGETPLHAMTAAIRGYERLFCGDVESAARNAEQAIVLGERYAAVDAAVIAQTCAARIALLQGDLATGLPLLDEVGARLMAGDASDLVTGMMLCEVVCAAQGLAMHDLAREWTDVMESWRHRSGFGGLHGRCRVHRAELLRISGPAEEAEEEALGACADLRPWMRREYGWPLVELGLIRFRRGDLAGAEDAFEQATAHAWCAQPGLALTHLARGRTEVAAALIADAIEHPQVIPWKERPPFGDLRLAPLLYAQGEIALAASDRAAAEGAAARLSDIAERFPSQSLRAMAAVTRARAALAAGELDEARDAAHASLALWADLEAPYDAASARVVLADVHAAAGSDALARAEWSTARNVFAGFGAHGRVAEITALLEEETAAEPGAISSADVVGEFIARDGLRRIAYNGAEVLVPDLKGFRYLARLLAAPGREFHVLDLVGLEHGDAEERGPDQSGIPVLDDEARAAYRRQLAEVDADIEDARENNDLARVELAERDRDYLVAALSSALGLAGRVRTTGGTAERARTSVARSLRYALQRLEEANPVIAGHLDRALRTGTYCSYSPDPLTPVHWSTEVPGTATG